MWTKIPGSVCLLKKLSLIKVAFRSRLLFFQAKIRFSFFPAVFSDPSELLKRSRLFSSEALILKNDPKSKIWTIINSVLVAE